MRCYALYRSEPGTIGRVYATWGLDGETLRSASLQELAIHLRSYAAGCAIFDNVQALLRDEAGEALLSEDETPLPVDEAPLSEGEAPLPEATRQVRCAPFRTSK